MPDDRTISLIASGAELHTLNPTAAMVWTACEAPVVLDDVVEQLAGEFRTDPEVIRRDVVDIIGQLIAAGLIAVLPDGEVPPTPTFSKLMLQPASACSACGPGPDYEVAVLVDVGTGVLAIGADDEIGTALESALGDRAIGRIDSPVDRPAYGVVIPTDDRTSSTIPVARLHRGPDVLLRSRNPQRVVDGLLAQIGAHLTQPGEVVLEGLVVGRGRAVVAVPVPANRVAFERAATRAGLTCADIPSVTLAAEGPAVIVGGARMDFDRAGLARVAAGRQRLGGEPVGLEWGRYDLTAILVAGSATVANVLGEMAPSVDSETTHLGLRDLVDRLRGVPIRSGGSIDAVAAVFGAGV